MNMNSWTILTALRDDLESYIETNKPVFRTIIELKQVPDTELANRSDIDQFRIGLYEQAPDVAFTVENGKAQQGTQSYELSLFYKVSRDNDPDEVVEKPVMEMKDLIVAWLRQVDASTLSNNELYNLSYAGSGAPIREPDYTSLLFDLEADRCLA